MASAGSGNRGRHGDGRALIVLAGSLSLAIHAALAAFVISHRSDNFGIAAPPSVAISVNIETTDILNSPEEDAQAPNSNAANYVPEIQEAKPEEEALADTAPPPEPEATETAENRVTEAEAKRLDEERERERVAQEAADREFQEAERLRREEARLVEQRRREEKETERREQERRKAEQAERIAREQARKRHERERGQNAAQASKGKQASKGRVSASRGSMLSYDATVHARIARNKPRRGGGNGRQVVVIFQVSPSGGLAFVRILRSSGNFAQDQSALSAVRRSAPFPVPPKGATAKRLNYTSSFTFR